MLINEKRYPVLIWGIIIVVLAWEAHVFAVFSLINGFAYDTFVRISLRHDTSAKLLVLDGNRNYADRGDEVWLPLLKNLLASHAEQVVFNFLPDRVTSGFYQLAAASGKVVFGRHLQTGDPYLPASLEPVPQAALSAKIVTGAIILPIQENGIFRSQLRDFIGGDDAMPVFETAAAENNPEPDDSSRIREEYLINFIGGSARIPKMQMEEAVSGHLIPEVLAGRTVFVGLHGVEPLSKYATPLSKRDGLTSDVLFHAFALDTLLSKRTISAPSEAAMLTAIGLVCALTLFYCQYLTFHQTFLLSLGSTFAIGLVSWLGLQTANLWIRPFELILAQWLCIALAWRYRIMEEQAVVEKTLAALSADLQEKFVPKDFYENDEDWYQIVDMINQSLNCF